MPPKRLLECVRKVLTPFEKKHFLLALSGGVDSMVLFSLLLYLKRRGEISFCVAHVDHRWREESTFQAKQLEEIVKAEGVPFYLKQLNPSTLKGNLELASREERFSFFSELQNKEAFSGVFLAHHRDDLAETVLKRVLEGAALCRLSGMKEHSTLGDLVLLRPFLSLSKKELMEVATKEGIPFFEDSTNLDPRFLRGKMRSLMLPLLEREFGKNISQSLADLGRQASELKEFMMERNPSKNLASPLLSLEKVTSLFESKWWIKEWTETQGLSLSKEEVNTIAKKFLTQELHGGIDVGEYRLEVVATGILLFPKFEILPPVPLILGRGVWGNFEYEVTEGSSKKMGWRAGLSSGFSALIPKEGAILGHISALTSKKNRLKWQKVWAEEKVPRILRDCPVIAKSGEVIEEFMTEKVFHQESEGVLLTLKTPLPRKNALVL